MTIEEREAAYDEARARILKYLEEREKSMEMSAREPSTPNQVSSSETIRAVKDDGSARTFTTGRSTAPRSVTTTGDFPAFT